MISLLPVTPQYICRAIHLSIPFSQYSCCLVQCQWWRSWKGGTDRSLCTCLHKPLPIVLLFTWMHNYTLTTMSTSSNCDKLAQVKKLNLDIAIIIYHQVIFKFSFPSRRVSINSWLMIYWMVSHLHDFQSGFCANHSTVTATQRLEI